MAIKRAAKKTATGTSRGSVRFRSANSGTFAVRFRKSSPTWETNLENNLVEEGLDPFQGPGIGETGGILADGEARRYRHPDQVGLQPPASV